MNFVRAGNRIKGTCQWEHDGEVCGVEFTTPTPLRRFCDRHMKANKRRLTAKWQERQKEQSDTLRSC